MVNEFFRPSPKVLDRLASSLAERRVDVTIVGPERCIWYGQDIANSLISRGVNVRVISIVDALDPMPNDPLSITLNDDAVRLVISPETLQK